MASIRREFSVAADPAQVWDAVRDFGALHERFVKGFVTSAKLEGDTRTITFANGAVAKERLIDIDDAARRLAYTAQSAQIEHHNGVVTVSGYSVGRTRLTWVIDVLPNSIAGYIGGMMDAGAAAMKETLESAAAKAK
jgi:hypothetical protein